MKRIVRNMVLGLLIISNISYLIVDHLALNKREIYRTSCDPNMVFVIEGALSGECRKSWTGMTECFEKWKTNRKIKECHLLRTEKRNWFKFWQWGEYLIHPKWYLETTE